MKKKQSLSISIPQPCGVPLHTMTPTEDGHYCAQCEKTVIDFRSLSDREFYKQMMLLRGKHTCGIFRNDQLNRRIPEPGATSRNFIPVAALLSGLLLGTQAASAQGEVSLHNKEQIVANADKSPQPSETQGQEPVFCLHGNISNAFSGTVIEGAVVSLFTGDSILLTYASSDSEGGYVLEVPGIENLSGLRMHCVAYDYAERVIDIDLNSQDLSLDIQLTLFSVTVELAEPTSKVTLIEVTNIMGNFMIGNIVPMTYKALPSLEEVMNPPYHPSSYHLDTSASTNPVGDGISIRSHDVLPLPQRPLPQKDKSNSEQIPPAVVPTSSFSSEEQDDDDTE